jgi:hypothetical protein
VLCVRKWVSVHRNRNLASGFVLHETSRTMYSSPKPCRPHTHPTTRDDNPESEDRTRKARLARICTLATVYATTYIPLIYQKHSDVTNAENVAVSDLHVVATLWRHARSTLVPLSRTTGQTFAGRVSERRRLVRCVECGDKVWCGRKLKNM